MTGDEQAKANAETPTIEVGPGALEQLLRIGAHRDKVIRDDLLGRNRFALLHDSGMKMDVIDTEAAQPQPRRKRARVLFHEIESLMRYTVEHADEASVIFADVNTETGAGSVVAVLDYHRKGGDETDDAPLARWGEHIAYCDLPTSVEWQRWSRLVTSEHNQAGFAAFIEDNIADVASVPVDPEQPEGEQTQGGADLLEMAKTLDVKQNAQFRSAVRLDNDLIQLTYQEDEEATAGEQGQMTIPRSFAIQIPIYRGGPHYIIRCRLRHRLARSAATVAFSVAFVAIHNVLAHAVDLMLRKIEQGADDVEGTGLKPLVGKLEKLNLGAAPAPFTNNKPQQRQRDEY